MTTNYSVRPDYEARTHELFANYISARGEEVSSEEIMIDKVFKAMWYSSLELDHIIDIAKAIYRRENLPADGVQAALKTLVKAKVLRSQTRRGVKLWEVNY